MIVNSIQIESAFSPPIVMNDPLRPGPPNPMLQALKPRITIQLAAGAPIVLQPYGDPRPTKWPEVKAGVVVGGLLLGYLAFLGAGNLLAGR